MAKNASNEAILYVSTNPIKSLKTPIKKAVTEVETKEINIKIPLRKA